MHAEKKLGGQEKLVRFASACMRARVRFASACMRVGRKKNWCGYMHGTRKDSAGQEKRSVRLQGACMHGRSRSAAACAQLTARDRECVALSYYEAEPNGFSRNER